MVVVQSKWHLFSFSYLNVLCLFSLPPISLWVLFLLACKQVGIIKVGQWRVVDGTFEGLGRRMLWSKWWSFESSYIFASLLDCKLCWVCYQNCNQKFKRQDLADKKESNGKQKTRNYLCTSWYTLEWLELLALYE